MYELVCMHVEITMQNISWYANVAKLTSVNNEQHPIFHGNVSDHYCAEG